METVLSGRLVPPSGHPAYDTRRGDFSQITLNQLNITLFLFVFFNKNLLKMFLGLATFGGQVLQVTV